jgi:His/Glu/Gln/Arg/opine family amino acid ABC transporter permease subunit
MFDYAFIARSLPLFLDGLQLTVFIGAVAIVGAALGGALVAALTMSSSRALRALGGGYVEAMRNTPMLVQMFVLYFGLPTLGLYPTAVASATAALILQNSAYVGEIYRSAIQSIPSRQMEAALAVGMQKRQAMLFMILPQALRRAMPPLGNQFIFVLKDTSIASTIAVAEITHTGKLLLDQSAAPYEIFLMMASLYVVLTGVVLGLVKLGERLFPVRA